MQTVLYADVLFAVNFSMDFISLWAAGVLGARSRRAWRMSLAAALGGVYGVVGVILGARGPLQYLTAAGVSLLMCLVAYGHCGGVCALLKQSALIWGCGALLGGLMTALLSLGGAGQPPGGQARGSVWLGAAAAAFCAACVIVRLIGARRGARQLSVTVEYRGNRVRFDALYDSGNLLQDPISGDPVILLSASLGRKLVGTENTAALLSGDGQRRMGKGLRFRFITLKNSSGGHLCTAFRPDKVTVNGRGAACLVAFSNCAATYFGGFPATVPGSLVH